MQDSSWVFRNFDEMALGKKRLDGAAKSSSNSNRNLDGDGGLGLEFIKHKRGFGKKIIYENTLGKSRELEALPRDILVRPYILISQTRFNQKSFIKKKKKTPFNRFYIT